MKGFRSICFIYAKENAYDACYLKEFFKWIGFSYLDCVREEKAYILQHSEKVTFDIMVSINSAISVNERQQMSRVPIPCFVELTISEDAEDEGILRDLLDRIAETLQFDEWKCRLLKLAEIYERYRLVEVLYGYCNVLMENFGDAEYADVDMRFSRALEEIRHLLAEDVMLSEEKDTFTEYILYARYECQREINDLLQKQGKMLRFDVEEYLQSVNEIYEYDEDFFKVEYLKANVAQQDCLYDSFSRYYMESCIKECPLAVCRSYHYYAVAKWEEKSGQYAAADRAYRLSYSSYPNNIKAIFKVAVEAKHVGDREMAAEYLEDITDIWKDEDDIWMLPLREVEYGYKTRMLLSILKDRQLKEQYVSTAERYLDFVRTLKEGRDIPERCFAKRMFRSQEQIVRICGAMLKRLDQSFFEAWKDC